VHQSIRVRSASVKNNSYFIHYALCFMLHDLHFILYTLYFVLCTLYFILCTLYFVLCTLYFVLCTLYFVLCRFINSILIIHNQSCLFLCFFSNMEKWARIIQWPHLRGYIYVPKILYFTLLYFTLLYFTLLYFTLLCCSMRWYSIR
jgi:hypothetical protein